MEGQPGDGTGVPGDGPRQFPVAGVEEMNLLVGAADGELFTVRAESQRQNNIDWQGRRIGWRRQCGGNLQKFLAARHFPETHGAVEAA